MLARAIPLTVALFLGTLLVRERADSESATRRAAASRPLASSTQTAEWPPEEVWRQLTERRRRKHWQIPPRTPQQIAAILNEETEIQFSDTPLNEALDFLSDLHQVTIVLDSEVDEEVQRTPITAELSGITLRNALRTILTPLRLTLSWGDEVFRVHTFDPFPRRND